MLEAKNLVKIYKPKRGVAVKALDDVSLKFPNRGMIFLLGKSGSGKSTLLNLLGGLDKYNSGDILIKGVSSKDFKQKHFDSYRNTYVGFIFQEYNILEEFSVGANIGLALELQGKKATDEEINRILKEVDLEGYGNRKPNELSGGQKQRVAIARALVKNPEIIMADEPTGALDSNTGRQVFDTLKKLSKDKLVIIVSHDREFSENYADRIIELADGKVISDVEYAGELDRAEIVETEESSNLKFQNNTIEVAEGYHLTEEDRIAINKYIDDLRNGNVVIKLDSKRVSNKKFVDTDQTSIGSHNGSEFKLIKSKLPFKNAIKIGASGLKHKKFRLIVTIILSCISFGLFGLSDTLGSYDHIKTCTNSLVDSNVTYASLVKGVKTGSGINEYYDTYDNLMSDNDIKEIEENIGTDFTPVYQPKNSSLELTNNMELGEDVKETDKIIYSMSLNGFGEISKETINQYGYKVLAGEIPDGNKNEVALSKYMYDSFVKFGYVNDGKKENIEKPEDIIGKTINIANAEYEIVAIIDTNIDMDRYLELVEEDEHVTTTEQITNFALMNEFEYCKNYSLAKIAMVGEGHIDTLIKMSPDIYEITDVWLYGYTDMYGSFDPYYVTEIEKIIDEDIIWIDGEKKQLKEKEIIIPKSMLYNSMGEEIDLTDSAVINEIKNIDIELEIWDDSSFEDNYVNGYKIVGILTDSVKYADTFVVCKDLFEKCISDVDGKYMYAVGNMPKKKADIKDMVSYCYRTDSYIRYELQNPVTYELSIISIILSVVSKIFFWVGIFFALFAALMLANFIGTSIAYKKQEIGILRAIGSRSNDVFRIFFSESFIIAMINFILSIAGVFVVTNAINLLIREKLGILVTVLHCGIRQVVLLFVVSVAVAFVASFLPVRKIAAKKPIDAIRKR